VKFAVLSRVGWQHILGKMVADALIMALALVAMWKSWILNTAVMIPWKCEVPVMNFAW